MSLDNDYLYTTAGEYYRSTPNCTDQLCDWDGDILPENAEITVDESDQEYCIGHYDGNQPWMPL